MSTQTATRTATGTFLGWCSGCKTTVRATDQFSKHTCGSWITSAKPIKARTTAHICGPKCTSALGPTCDCECGGEHHGQDHH